MMGERARADAKLVSQGLADTRSRAQALILAGQVVRGDTEARIDKAGALVPRTVELRLKGEGNPYVSRGGLKLRAALDAFALRPVAGRCLDVGASTGGFTDCLLQHGASHVTAVDVGYGQLAWKLRQDKRVKVVERCNIRHAPADLVPSPVDWLVCDVSFISLKLVLAPALVFAHPAVTLVALIKPQFEVGAAHIVKGGIVRDGSRRQAAVDDVCEAVKTCGLTVRGVVPSPITGAKGNHEFLVYATGPRRR